MATEIAQARLRIWGMPCWCIENGPSAVWQSDEITILARIGSHYFCKVSYGEVIHTWIHKRLLRRVRGSSEMRNRTLVTKLESVLASPLNAEYDKVEC